MLAGAVVLTGCQDDAVGDCGGQPCDIPMSAAELDDALSGHGDPVAEWLRANADEAAVIGDDVEDVVASVGQSLGCADEQRHSFVVQSNIALAPKAVVTHCSDQPTEASRVLTIFEPTEDLSDLDGQRFRMAAWDETAGRYRRYQVTPHPDGGLGVAVEPEFCLSCHNGMSGLSEWSPIMNEMTNPWAQWNAAPGFESLLFDDEMVMASAGETFDWLTAGDRLDSASNLEPVIRSAIDRVTAAEIRHREEAPDLETAAALLRPVFCDTGVNYESEIHDSGEVKAAVIIDPAIRRLFQSVLPGSDWDWLRDDVVKLPAPDSVESAVKLIAIRGELGIQAEAALVSRQILTPLEALRVRAIDWKAPVMSAARCQLFESTLEAAEHGAVDLGDPADVAGQVRALFEHSMTLPSGDSLLLADDSAIVAIADGDDPDAQAALAEGNLGGYTTSIPAWGDEIEAHVSGLLTEQGRERLREEAVRRGCIARRLYPIAPIIPGTEQCP
jgi:hypothetical protein